MQIKDEDQKWLKQNYFRKKFCFNKKDNGYELTGIFSFTALFDENKQGYYINPSKEFQSDKNFISDEYEVLIYFPEEDDFDNNFYRNIKETSGKIEEVANRLRGGKVADLHINSMKGTLCIIGLFQEKYDINIRSFIEGAFLQFFYDQSFYALHEKWPRGEYAHGLRGVLESYFDACQEIEDVERYEVVIKIIKVIHGFKQGEPDLVKEVVNIISVENFPELVIHSKYMQGIFMLKRIIKRFNLKIEV